MHLVFDLQPVGNISEQRGLRGECHTNPIQQGEKTNLWPRASIPASAKVLVSCELSENAVAIYAYILVCILLPVVFFFFFFPVLFLILLQSLGNSLA